MYLVHAQRQIQGILKPRCVSDPTKVLSSAAAGGHAWHTGEIAHQRGNVRRQRLLALVRLSAQRLQVHPAQTRKLIHVEVAVEGGEAALGASLCHDGGQLLEGGSFDGRGHWDSCG